MSDFNELLNAVKKCAAEAVEAGNPVNICFGKVISASPLKILVDQKMILSSSQLVLTGNVTEYTSMVTVQWSTESENISHTHDIDLTDSGGDTVIGKTKEKTVPHAHDVKGIKQMTFHNKLEQGEEVILLRMQGGQKYIVLDRIGGGLHDSKC